MAIYNDGGVPPMTGAQRARVAAAKRRRRAALERARAKRQTARGGRARSDGAVFFGAPTDGATGEVSFG